jgi:y4mF family transcriptional regulator
LELLKRRSNKNLPLGIFRLTFDAKSKKFPAREIYMDSTTPITIGQAIRRARKAMGLRQPELAAAAGVGLRFLVELERGKPTAQLGLTLMVLQAVGLDLKIIGPGEDGPAP